MSEQVKCWFCGKQFNPDNNAPEKVVQERNVIWYCSYRCYCEVSNNDRRK